MYLETSKDILNVAIAFSVVLVAAFLAWLLWYLIAMLRDARAMVSDVRRKVEAIDNAIQSIRGKVETGVSSFGVMAAGLKQVIAYVMEKRADAIRKKMEDFRDEGPPKKGRGKK